jgi:hypothetical protein
MTDIKDELEKDKQKIEKQLENLDKETLEKLAKDLSIALEYARKGILRNEPENLSDEYVKTLAREMQAIAKMRLKERFSN